MSTRRIREYLVGHKIPFDSIHHPYACTAHDVAESAGIPEMYMAKVVIVSLDGELAIVAVPATCSVDLTKLRRQTGVLEARLADEAEFRDRFMDCQLGAVPPFGNVFGMETLMDRQLAAARRFGFNAGTHRDVYVILSADYARLVRPRIVEVAVEPRVDAKPAIPGPRLSRIL